MSEACVFVTGVGRAEGSLAAAAALACAGSEADSAALLAEMTDGRGPRPALVATAAARRLEERLAAHLPEASCAARGQFCHLTLPAGEGGLELLPAALSIAREPVAVAHLPAVLLRTALDSEPASIDPRAVVLRADLDRDRALTGLAVRALMARRVAVAVLKRRLSWVPARRALFGVLPGESPDGLPGWLLDRCLEPRREAV
jgi:hypothetical protein